MDNYVSSTADLAIAVLFISNLLRIISFFNIVSSNNIVVLRTGE